MARQIFLHPAEHGVGRVRVQARMGVGAVILAAFFSGEDAPGLVGVFNHVEEGLEIFQQDYRQKAQGQNS